MTEHFRKLERMYAAAPINDWFKPTLTVSDARAVLTMSLRDDFHHAGGSAHGLIYFKMLDDCTYFAANSIVEDVFLLTAKFEIEFLKPIATGVVQATARVTERDEKRIVAVGELFDDSGGLVGRGVGYFARSSIKLTKEVHYD